MHKRESGDVKFRYGVSRRTTVAAGLRLLIIDAEPCVDYEGAHLPWDWVSRVSRTTKIEFCLLVGGQLTNTNLAQIGARALGNGKRFVERRRIHVLFNNSEAIVVDVTQHIPERKEIDRTLGWLNEHIHTHGCSERDIFGFDFLPYILVNTLKMQVGNPLVMSAHEVYRVPAAIGMMTGVIAERHTAGIGLFQKCLNLIIIINMCVGMMMEDQLQPESIARDIGYLVRSID